MTTPNTPPNKFASVQFAVELLCKTDGITSSWEVTGQPVNVASVGPDPADADYALVTLRQPIPYLQFVAGYSDGTLTSERPRALFENGGKGRVIIDASNNVTGVSLNGPVSEIAPYPIRKAFSLNVGW